MLMHCEAPGGGGGGGGEMATQKATSQDLRHGGGLDEPRGVRGDDACRRTWMLANQASSGHLLVATRNHRVKVADMCDDEGREMGELLRTGYGWKISWKIIIVRQASGCPYFHALWLK